MILHKMFGRHVPDQRYNRWEDGHFVSSCSLCGQPMIKLPGLPWRSRSAST